MKKWQISRLFSKNKVRIKGNLFIPEPLSLEEVMFLVILLAPYIGLIKTRAAEFNKILEATSEDEPLLLSAFLTTFSEEIKPQDFTRVFAILLRQPPEWFRGVKAQELINALPALDRVNNFSDIVASVMYLARCKNA